MPLPLCIGGSTISRIQWDSKATISIDKKTDFLSGKPFRKVMVSGLKAEIAHCVSMMKVVAIAHPGSEL